MKHRRLFSRLMSILTFQRPIDTATIDGIKYNLNISDHSAEVVSNKFFNGSCEIPSTVEYHRVIYAVTSIKKKAFWRCGGITSLSLPPTLTSIGIGAFFGCKNLKSLHLSESVVSIGLYAFNYCESLSDVYYNSSHPAPVDDRIFDASLYTHATLHVVASALSKIKETAPWRYFTNIIVS